MTLRLAAAATASLSAAVPEVMTMMHSGWPGPDPARDPPPAGRILLATVVPLAPESESPIQKLVRIMQASDRSGTVPEPEQP